MKTPFFVMLTNGPGVLAFPTRDDLEEFAAEASATVSSMLMVISESKADDVWIAQAIAHCHSLAYQVQQATAVLRKGPAACQADPWQAMIGYSDDMQPLPTQGSVNDADFSAGQALASALLTEAESFPFEDMSWEALRKFREGAPQNRFARKYLTQLVAKPELTDGFSAVLSAALGAAWANGSVDASLFRDALPAEYQAGEVGADGTQQWDTDDRPPGAAPVLKATSRKRKAVLA